MDSIRERLWDMWEAFVQIVTCVALGSSIYIYVFWGKEEVLSVDLLWQILGVSALCALWCVVYWSKEELSKKAMLARNILHFILVDLTVLICGFWFGWFFLSDWKMIVGMEITVIAVYMTLVGVNYLADRRKTDKMNRKLQERRTARGESIE
ncbi:MAG: DUF3021 domain-containing protein [Lachnospiraceae bacterium]|nr:DUF3021 domain-containing protein [Lachnospiraceae bacterium]